MKSTRTKTKKTGKVVPSATQLQAIVKRLESGASGLIAESTALGFKGSKPLHNLLTAMLGGAEKYNAMLRRAIQARSGKKEKVAKKGSKKKPAAKKTATKKAAAPKSEAATGTVHSAKMVIQPDRTWTWNCICGASGNSTSREAARSQFKDHRNTFGSNIPTTQPEGAVTA